MSHNVGDRFFQSKLDDNMQIVVVEMEVVSMEVLPQEDGSTVVIENVKPVI